MLRNKLASRLMILVFAVALSACSTIAPNTSTLSKPEELTTQKDGSLQYLQAPLPAGSELYLSAVELKQSTLTNVTLTEEEKSELINELKQQLVKALSTKYKLVEVAGDDTNTVRATITDVKKSSVAGNVLSTIFLFVPVDKGAIAVNFEVKSPTGKRVAALSAVKKAELLQYSGAYSTVGQAKIALAKSAVELAALIEGNVKSN
jgi:uncharacterized lipoprotein YmbA